MTKPLTAIVVLIAVTTSVAQKPNAGTAPLTFEVASVKSNKSVGASNMIGCYFPQSATGLFPKGMCITRNMSLLSIIGYAYSIDRFNVSNLILGRPSWISSEKYDIEAKAEN